MRTAICLIALLASVVSAAEPVAVDLINPKVGMKGRLPKYFERQFISDYIDTLYTTAVRTDDTGVKQGPMLFFRGFKIDPLVDCEVYDDDVQVVIASSEKSIINGKRETVFIVRPLKKR